MSAASKPRAWLTRNDSCGDSIAGVVSDAVCTGCVGSFISMTKTPRPSAALVAASFGNSRVLSKKAQSCPALST